MPPPPKFIVISRQHHLPEKSEIEKMVTDFYLRMRRNLHADCTRNRLNYAQDSALRSVTRKIYTRLENTSGHAIIKDGMREMIGRLALDGARIMGPTSTHAVDEWSADVHARTPWMGELTTVLMKHMRKKVPAGETGLSMPPLILVGEPGNGKSWYAQMIGEVAGTPVREIDVGAGNAGFRISGLEKGWHSSTPGIPVEMMLTHRVANPVIVVNEICKAGNKVSSTSGTVTSLTTALLQHLERETASRFECPAFRIRFNLSRVNWILTANNVETIPAPLRDRCMIFNMPEVRPDVAGLMFDTLSQSVKPDVDPELLTIARENVIDSASRKHISLRQIRRVLDRIAMDVSEPLH